MYREKLDLQGRAYIVAGGGQGMGLAICEALAEAGGRVTVVDLDPERAAQAAGGLGGQALTVTADVRDPADIERIIGETTDRWGGFHGVATVVGGIEGYAAWAPTWDIEPEDWDRVGELNLRHAFLLLKACVSHFMSRRVAGSMVSVSSVSGLGAAPNHAAYGAAKAGLMSLTRTLASECGPHGIRVNSIAPGAIVTERSREAYKPADVERLSGVIPLGRLGVVEDIAGAALFLLSDLSAYITGQTIVVDGGVMNVYPFGLQKPEST